MTTDMENADLDTLFDLVGTAGGLPLSELRMRSTGPDDAVLRQLHVLEDEGLVTIEGGVPRSEELLARASGIVKLTRKGTTRFFR